MTELGLRSIAETQAVVDTLSTLLHYPKDIKFTDSYLEMIMKGGANTACTLHLHPGMTCSSYAVMKFKR